MLGDGVSFFGWMSKKIMRRNSVGKLASWRLLFVLVLSGGALTPIFGDDIYAPQPITRPHQRSVQLDIHWFDFLNFSFNRGPGAVDYKSEVLKFLDPSFLRAQGGFKSFSNSRLTISTFEFRSIEVIREIEKLLEKGVHLRIVMDGAYIYPFKLPSDEIWNSWTDSQKIYFLRSYDKDSDGTVSVKDSHRVNRERRLAVHAWEMLIDLKSRFSNQVDLIHPPIEVVPSGDRNLYPRLHHMKLLSYEIRSSKQASWGEPIFAWATSANFTETGLSRRITNTDDYIEGADPVYDPKSEGQIQFGASFRAQSKDSREAIKALIGHLDEWAGAYQAGKTFDQVEPGERQNPRVVFKDGSSLQAFFSEGVQLNGKQTIDPLWVMAKILARKDIEVITYYDAQFVFTHTQVARLLRSTLQEHKPERFGLMVDSSQALANWSALPDLIFAPFRREGFGVYPGKALESYEPLPLELDWQRNIRIYRGGDTFYSRNNDKLHLKARYFEFIDSMGITHHVVLWGSANSSHNASKLNADVYYLFQSPDPKVGEQIRPFFETLLADPRMHSYSLAFLEKSFFENFAESKDLRKTSYIKRWESFLTKKSRKESFESLIEVLRLAGPSNAKGKLMLQFLEWHLKYSQRISQFSWEDLDLIRRLSQPQAAFNSDFLDEVLAAWTSSIPVSKNLKGAKISLRKMLGTKLAAANDLEVLDPRSSRDLARFAIQENCRDFIAVVKGQKDLERLRYPIVKLKLKGRKPKAE
jgi:hypothetical protein